MREVPPHLLPLPPLDTVLSQHLQLWRVPVAQSLVQQQLGASFPGGQGDTFKASSGTPCSCSGLTFLQPWVDIGIMFESPKQRPAHMNTLVSPDPSTDTQPQSPPSIPHQRSRNHLEVDAVTFRLLSC